MRQTFRALMLGVTLVALMVACVASALLSEIRATASDDPTPVEFEVAPGDTTSDIATNLREAELIRQPLLFTLLARLHDYDGRFQAGTYALRPDMSMSEIMVILQNSPTFAEIQVTVPEGLRIEEVAELFGAAGFPNITTERFLETARDPEQFRDAHFLLKDVPPGGSLEGYLFPDTYRFAENATADEVIERMLDRFDEQFASFEREIQVQASVHQLVTMASIVQREAVLTAEMPLIAAVFWNRLKEENWPVTGDGRLQADPTVQYALGTPENWWPRLDIGFTAEQINSVSSEYNTRANPGLPPGPIANPGLDALRAAANPDASANYLFFVAACGTPGAHNFAVTFEEFQRYEQEFLTCPTR